ncbi:NVEALA domain-containing protein [Gabonibacter massiliensis]|uniref:NVEALA domain-containing protein n=1 Tax=Gabonibacter massiliensis TaxID=1720195 RepID=UPI00073F2DCC|nr:NVEALA domain-containing protein [Gabonibacter massiliensis]
MEHFIHLSLLILSHQIKKKVMKIRILIFTVILVLIGLISVNLSVSKDNASIDICLENIEALGSGEGGNTGHCKAVGTLCLTTDGKGNVVYYPGLAAEP